MKKILLNTALLFLSTILILSTQNSCKKETLNENITETVIKLKTDSVYNCTQSIQGLWVGTYTVGAGQPVPAGTQFYFAFSIYPNGTVSYKSKGYYNNSVDYITFADGTWTLNGNTFNFNVKTINTAGGGPQHTQIGSATFNISNGSLTSGTIADINAPINTADWYMNKIY